MNNNENETVSVQVEAETPNFAAVIRSFEYDTVENALLGFKETKKLWLALGAKTVTGSYQVNENGKCKLGPYGLI